MKTPTWFSNAERIDALETAANSWIGTPFGQNARVKGQGGGVSCQMLAAALMVESGCVGAEFPPMAPMSWAQHKRESLIVPYMDAHPRFQRLPELEAPVAGDILGFKIEACIHHMGTMLRDGLFIHVWKQTGTMKSLLADPTYATRLAAIWRPKP